MCTTTRIKEYLSFLVQKVDQGIVSSGPLMVKAILHCKDEKKEIVLIQVTAESR